jgi:hypothetical protein
MLNLAPRNAQITGTSTDFDRVARTLNELLSKKRPPTFIQYLYKTLEYAARGVPPSIAYSLDEALPDGKRRRIDVIARQMKTVATTNQNWQ